MSNNVITIWVENPLKSVPIRGWTAKLKERAYRAAQSPVLRIRPRVSLFSGSVLVLMTLFLPIAYEGCGPNRTGIEFLSGQGIWPGALSFGLPYAEFSFYAITLGLATFTVALLLQSCLRPGVFQSPSLAAWTFAISGTLALYVMSDFFWIFLGLEAQSQFLSPIGIEDETSIAVAAGATILVLVSRLRSKFLPTERWAIYLFGITGAVSLLVVADFFASQSSGESSSGSFFSMAALSLMYWLIPAVRWYRLGLSIRSEKKAQWIGIRTRVLQMFVPLVVIDCYFLAMVVKDGLWGFLALFIGIQMMALGYMKLARSATQDAAAKETPSALSGVATVTAT